jgi:DNA-binding CsgD family transcriptional regulator/tetratricopeptide (TPR) repeat protein
VVTAARPGLGLAGRRVEQQLLASALEGTASGHPCAVIVHGEAGVGKTRLVREVCENTDAQVLWGTCVRFGEASVPFAAVTGALQAWLAHADAATRAEVLSGAGELGVLLPSLSDARTGESKRLLPLIDLVLNRLAERRPTVVVIDDLQWADRSSLDVLAYLIAGFRDQRLVLLATCRDEHRGEGHPLHRWLADLRRMPMFSEIHLDRLDLAATEAQIRSLLGRPVDIELAAQVYERSGGNAYLTELLVRGLSGNEAALPATAPTALSEALLASWHGMSAAARQVTRVLAVGGRPMAVEVLAGVAAEHGADPAGLSSCLTEAQDQGVVRVGDEGRPWFRHPLLAEVLYGGLPAGEAALIHATYVSVLESLPDKPPAAELAIHSQRAGRIDGSYRWSVIAANNAEEVHATAELAMHLERACTLWEQASPDVRGSRTGRIELLRRATDACVRAGHIEAAAVLADQALALVDREREPLEASNLLRVRGQIGWELSAPGQADVSELIEAVELTQAFPDRAEHARALAALASTERWALMLPEAMAHAEQALQAARRSGSDVALAHALNVRADAYIEEFATPSLLADTEEAWRLARQANDSELMEDAAICRVNCLTGLGRIREGTEVARAAYEEVLAAGSLQWGYFLAFMAAAGMFRLGRWDECRALLRTALPARAGGIPGAFVRVVAAQLAVRSGRLPEARQHLNRTLELASEDFPGLLMQLNTVGTEIFLASGEPQKALEWLRRRIVLAAASTGSDAEDIFVDIARAAADAAQAARDTGDTRGVTDAVAFLDEMIGDWPREPFSTRRSDTAEREMSAALFEAESARCRGDADQAERWQLAIKKCHEAIAPWQEAHCRLRCAQALVVTSSPAVSDLLREAYRAAVGMGAQPLLDEIASLARLLRITLREPTPIATSVSRPGRLTGLTTREREILSYLATGRSNSEIAKELVISDKTVSVHVSNILRKTGTANRVEAAALADRVNGHPDH